ncbi:MAG: MFS transporter [Thermodesulfobacteriota bacterium]
MTKGWKELGLPRTVFVLGLVSFFTDLSSEMIYPLLPVFLAETLGASAAALGIIEGVAESTASVLKLVSGFLSDLMKKRKIWVLGGYGLSSAMRPLIGLARVWPAVLFLRFLDRVGKGLRTSPRDALIAEATPASIRGRAYGFHRSMDHAGAVAGPLVAALLLSPAFGISMRSVFLWSFVPGIVVICLIVFGVKETAKTAAPAAAPPAPGPGAGTKSLSRPFKGFLAANCLFTLGNSSDAFLLLYLAYRGVSPEWIAILWSCLHVVKMASTYICGRLSDSCGRPVLILAGWLLYAAVYAAFGLELSLPGTIAVFLCYGLYYGFTEPCEKALVADLSSQTRRGTAFGWYHAVTGFSALPASILFGVLYKAFGAPAAFFTGAALALCACPVLMIFVGKNPVCGME